MAKLVLLLSCQPPERGKWIEVDEKDTVYKVLKEANHDGKRPTLTKAFFNDTELKPYQNISKLHDIKTGDTIELQ